MELIHFILYAYLRFRFLDLQTHPCPLRPVPAVCRIHGSREYGNLSDLTVALSQYEILLCSETLVSDMLHVSELLVQGFGRPVLLCREAMVCNQQAIAVKPGIMAWLNSCVAVSAGLKTSISQLTPSLPEE